jgi:hypothetical protein
MSITITLTEKAERLIRKRASEQDLGLAEVASDLLEKKVREEFPEYREALEPHPLLKLAGMFSSGKTDTAERHSEILRDSIKIPGGFGGGD